MRRGVLLGLAVFAAVLGYVGWAWSAAGSTGRHAVLDLAGQTVDVSHRDRGSLAGELDRLDAALARPVTISAAGRTAQLVPSSSGMRLDRDATLNAATGFTLDPRRVWAKTVGSYRVRPVTVVNRDALAATLRATAGRLGISPPVDAGVRIVDGTPQVTPSSPGQVIDPADAAAAFADGWPHPPVALTVSSADPQISDDAAKAAVTDVVNPALAGPVTVTVGGREVVVPASSIGKALRMQPKDGKLVADLDGTVLRQAVLDDAPTLASTPVDAKLVLQDSGPVVVPGQDGVTLDPQTLAAAVTGVLAKSGDQRRVAVQASTVPPKVTTAAIQALGVTKEMSYFATRYSSNVPRTHNIRQAVSVVNGTLLEPGEEFSLNRTLGERTAANGYKIAPVIDGGRLVDGFGGGVSQVATTLFNGMYFAGLDELEHHPHSMYFRRYPEGREATVNWGSKDLRFRNDSGHAVMIQMWLAGGQVHVKFWGTPVWKITSVTGPRRNITGPSEFESKDPRCIPQSPSDGFDSRGGAEVKREVFETHYYPEHKVTCTGRG